MKRNNVRSQGIAGLTLAAMGVVYGDIGTSPLYAVKEIFNPTHGIPLSVDTIVGGVSAIFWALMIVVSLKYVLLIMRVDNKGEGGIMALLALASSSVPKHPRWSARIVLLGFNCWCVTLRFGFMDRTDVPNALQLCAGLGLGFNMMETSFFVSREKIASAPGKGMAQWREYAFARMVQNAGSVVDYFNLPSNRVIELGTRVEI